jgi:aryl sulfotransferase
MGSDPDREYRSLVSDNRRWRSFAHRPGDIFVCTPPKTGTTWMQTIVASLRWPAGDAPGLVLHAAPWFDARFFPVDDLVARLENQTHRRSVKTHTPADGIPWFDDCKYIFVGRDGRDACMSLLNHMANMRPEVVVQLSATAVEDGIELGPRPERYDDVHAFFAWWLSGDFFHHIESFVARRDQPNLLLVHYQDLLDDLEGEMRRVAAFLDVDVPASLWPEVVQRCTFAAMKARSAEINDFDRLFVGGAETFLFKGTNGRWRDVLTSDELAAYDRAVAERLSIAAAAWLAGGRSALALPQ